MEFAYYFEILGGRHKECAYYFEVDGTWNVPYFEVDGTWNVPTLRWTAPGTCLLF